MPAIAGEMNPAQKEYMTMTNREALLAVREAYNEVSSESQWIELEDVQEEWDKLLTMTLEEMSPEMLEQPAAEQILRMMYGASELQKAAYAYDEAQTHIHGDGPWGTTPKSLIESIQETA